MLQIYRLLTMRVPSKRCCCVWEKRPLGHSLKSWWYTEHKMWLDRRLFFSNNNKYFYHMTTQSSAAKTDLTKHSQVPWKGQFSFKFSLYVLIFLFTGVTAVLIFLWIILVWLKWGRHLNVFVCFVFEYIFWKVSALGCTFTAWKLIGYPKLKANIKVR